MAYRNQDQQRPDRGSRYRSQDDHRERSARGDYGQGHYAGYGNFGQGNYQGNYDQSGRDQSARSDWGRNDWDRGAASSQYRQGQGGQRDWDTSRESGDVGYGRPDEYNRDYYTGGTYAGSSADQNSSFGSNRYDVNRYEQDDFGSRSNYYGQGSNQSADYGYGYGSTGSRMRNQSGSSSDRGWSEPFGEGQQYSSERGWQGSRGAQGSGWSSGLHRGKGPKGYTRTDDRIKESISERLREDAHIDASEITVTVSGGKVTLDGTVDSRQAKNHAEDIVEHCGCDDVQNNLRVQKSESMSPGKYGTSTTMTGATGSGASLGTGSDTETKRRNN
ncbi:MAG TPA: BON domain-containing protein [Steroidobacteraceae bacterium]|nr:BON domain-containing protein [Steroidobacteraceae bacterium]